MHDRLDMEEVEDIYLPLSRLLVDVCRGRAAAVPRAAELSRHRGFQGALHHRRRGFGRGRQIDHLARAAGAAARWPNTPKVDLVTTDGFLYPNAVLAREGLMEKKGFPESYDLPELLRFLSGIKAGRRPMRAPVYSHIVYDVVPNEWIEIDRPDILIVEGLNVLQTGRPPKDGKAVPFVSDFFDFSVYIDADEDVLERWYVERFLALRLPRSAIRCPTSIAIRGCRTRRRSTTAKGIWNRINLVNLRENILPTRQRADLILTKNEHHSIDEVALRQALERDPEVGPAAGKILRSGRKRSRRVAIGVRAEMLDIARVDRRNRQHDQHVGGAELVVDHRAVADKGAEPQIALDQRRQCAQAPPSGRSRLRHAVHVDMALRQRRALPVLRRRREMMQKRQRQRERIRIGAVEARAADHHVDTVPPHIAPDAVPQQLDGALVAIGRQHAGAAELEEVRSAMAREQAADVEFAGAVEAADARSATSWRSSR